MEFWKTLPVKPGAKEAIQSLRDAGHDILWVTSPYPPCYGWASERMAWLARNFDVHPHDVCITHRKGCVTGDIFIDDKPENIAEWQEMNPRGRAFIYAHAFNASETFPRITWDTMWNSINQK
jgi:5'(3')-deoxyribonucleotidase